MTINPNFSTWLTISHTFMSMKSYCASLFGVTWILRNFDLRKLACVPIHESFHFRGDQVADPSQHSTALAPLDPAINAGLYKHKSRFKIDGGRCRVIRICPNALWPMYAPSRGQKVVSIDGDLGKRPQLLVSSYRDWKSSTRTTVQSQVRLGIIKTSGKPRQPQRIYKLLTR